MTKDQREEDFIQAKDFLGVPLNLIGMVIMLLIAAGVLSELLLELSVYKIVLIMSGVLAIALVVLVIYFQMAQEEQQPVIDEDDEDAFKEKADED